MQCGGVRDEHKHSRLLYIACFCLELMHYGPNYVLDETDYYYC